jgi:mannose-1-phosphate guanylyltransferase / mannose-6-phosphate isomerase
MIHENESLYIPKTTQYSLENLGKVSFVMIEVEEGDCLEDDIVV